MSDMAQDQQPQSQPGNEGDVGLAVLEVTASNPLGNDQSLLEEQKPSPLLLPDRSFFRWHSVLPGQDGRAVLVKFIEADQ